MVIFFLQSQGLLPCLQVEREKVLEGPQWTGKPDFLHRKLKSKIYEERGDWETKFEETFEYAVDARNPRGLECDQELHGSLYLLSCKL